MQPGAPRQRPQGPEDGHDLGSHLQQKEATFGRQQVRRGMGWRPALGDWRGRAAARHGTLLPPAPTVPAPSRTATSSCPSASLAADADHVSTPPPTAGLGAPELCHPGGLAPARRGRRQRGGARPCPPDSGSRAAAGRRPEPGEQQQQRCRQQRQRLVGQLGGGGTLPAPGECQVHPASSHAAVPCAGRMCGACEVVRQLEGWPRCCVQRCRLQLIGGTSCAGFRWRRRSQLR